MSKVTTTDLAQQDEQRRKQRHHEAQLFQSWPRALTEGLIELALAEVGHRVIAPGQPGCGESFFLRDAVPRQTPLHAGAQAFPLVYERRGARICRDRLGPAQIMRFPIART